jgi:hypothetical protein
MEKKILEKASTQRGEFFLEAPHLGDPLERLHPDSTRSRLLAVEECHRVVGMSPRMGIGHWIGKRALARGVPSAQRLWGSGTRGMALTGVPPLDASLSHSF